MNELSQEARKTDARVVGTESQAGRFLWTVKWSRWWWWEYRAATRIATWSWVELGSV